ncbi:hypothetical protein Gocc_3077 [Gaiella occulta]|uniref:Uncharacterized protein n=1 Tax=Gaiella occulta TaxID=1002870 RepID=A0A7M2YUV5_9ACTN|nr:hypothetical protein Gocc_3077 [Gaiella occulta]
MHLDDLEGRIDAYLRTQPIQIREQHDRDGVTRHIQWIATTSNEPPAELGLIVGDWAQNVRAALDYTVYELVRRETGDDDPRWTQFPIIVDEARYAGQEQTRLPGAPAWSLPVFRGLQPFSDGADAAYHPLAVLADVSNRDKHRLLHTAATEIAGSQARVSGTSMLAIRRLAQNPGIVEGERVLLDAMIDTDGDNFQIELNLRLAVALEGIEAPINALAAVITDEVAAIVEWFTPALD